MKHLILIFVFLFSTFLLPSKAQDSDNNDQEPIPRIKVHFNPVFEKIFSNYNKEEADGRPEGGLTDDDGSDLEARPSGKLTDDAPDGLDSNSEGGRPPGGLSDSILEGK